MPYKFLDECYARSKQAKIDLAAHRDKAKDKVRLAAKRRNIELELAGPQPYPITQPPAYRTVAPVTIDECHTPPSGYYLYPCLTLEELANFVEVDRKVIEKLVRENSERYPTVKPVHVTTTGIRQGGYGRIMGMETVRRLLADIHELTGAPIDRVSLLLWMSGTRAMNSRESRDSRDAKPFYEAKIEAEIKRIAGLDDPARTIQAQELLERYREVEAIVKGSKKVGGGRQVQFRQALEAIIEGRR